MPPGRRSWSTPLRPPVTEAVLPSIEQLGGGEERERAEGEENAALRRRLVISAVLSLPVLVLAMVPALQFDNWQWLSLQLATPVVLWGAWPFHKAAWQNAKHATATMDTLISVGVLAAWPWSVYALFLGDAGMPGMRMPFELFPERGAGSSHIYLEVAAVVTTLILLGRYFEARAKRRAGAALKALVELGAKDVAVLDDARRARRGSLSSSSCRPAVRGPAGREGRNGRHGGGGLVGDGHDDAHRGVGAGRGRARRGRRRCDRERRRAPGRPGDPGGF